MRSYVIAIAFAAVMGIVSACCDSDPNNMFGCCGKGKCNIFCCNCNGGCKPLSTCCNDACINWCHSTGEFTAKCEQYCDGHCQKKTTSPLRAAVVQTNNTMLGLSDKKIFAQIDKEGTGSFTYDQFLSFKGAKDTDSWRHRFDLFDSNGDGKITPDEMRLPDDTDPTPDDTEDEPEQHDEL